MPTSEIAPASYYRLCDDAAALGIPTSLDDPASPGTVNALLDAVVLAKQRAWIPWTCGPFPLRAEIAASYGVSYARGSATRVVDESKVTNYDGYEH